MSRSALTLKALAARLARPGAAAGNRLSARRARLGTRPKVAETLPEPVLLGDADRGEALVAGRWPVPGRETVVGDGSIWDAAITDPRLEESRQSCLWLDDLAALGNRAARLRAQAWVQDWIRRYGHGSGPGWRPEIAGRRAKRWATHAAMLTQGLDKTAADRFWKALSAQQRYLSTGWPKATEGVPRLRALTALVWTGIVLPHPGHDAALGDLASVAETMIDAEGGVASRAPEDLAEALILMIWTARLVEDAGQTVPPPLLSAVARAVPVTRALRMGDGSMAEFHGGGAGSADALDQALAELRLGVQPKPKLPMGFARLTGGRTAVVMDGAAPPGGDAAITAHAGTLAFEMSVGRQPLIVNAGTGAAFGPDWARLSRQTAAHSTLDVDGRSSARIVSTGLAARTFGPRLEDGPSLVSVKQAHDATGMWLLATHDGYVESHGLLHERRIFVDARGLETRGEDIVSVTDARARARYDRVARAGAVTVAARFHLHPEVTAELDGLRQLVALTLPGGEVWVFRAAGGFLELEDSVRFDPARGTPTQTRQMVVRAEVVEYLGQITWSFARTAEAPAGEPGAA
jgi:uncharacterized heparinase superfamily protein